MPFHPHLDGRHVRPGLVPGRQDRLGRPEEGLAFRVTTNGRLVRSIRGTPGCPRVAAHGLAGGRLGDEVQLGAPGEGPKTDDIAVYAQRFQVHERVYSISVPNAQDTNLPY